MTSLTQRPPRVVISQRHAVQGDDLPGVSIELHVDVAVRGRIHNSPELALAGSNANSGANCAIHGKDLLDFLSFSSTALRRDSNLASELGCIRVMLDGASAQNNHSLRESRQLWNITLNSFDDDYAGHAIQNLTLTLAVRMSVVPVQSRRLIGRNADRIVQRLSGHGDHAKHIVLRGLGRNTQPMKVKVRHIHARTNRALLAGCRREVIHVGDVQCVSGRNTDDGRYRLPLERKTVPTLAPAYRAKRQRSHGMM